MLALDDDALVAVVGACFLRDLAAISRCCGRLRLASAHRRAAIARLGAPPFGLSFEGVLTSRSVFMGGRSMGDEGLKAFSEACAFGALPRVEILDFQSNGIGAASMAVFASLCARGALQTLKELNLGFNSIGEAGARSLASALAVGSLASLQKLYVAGNGISSAGTTALAREIGGGALTELEELHLFMNDADDAAMKALSGALATGTLPSLKNIILSVAFGHPDTTELSTLKARCSSKGVDLVCLPAAGMAAAAGES